MVPFVTDFSKRVTVFTADEKWIYFDGHGQTATLEVSSEPVNGMGALLLAHRRRLREAMASIRESQVDKPDSAKFNIVKAHLETMLEHLLECTFTLPGADNPRDELGRRTLSWCIYDRMRHYVLGQNEEENAVFLVEQQQQPLTFEEDAEEQQVEEEEASSPMLIPELPTFDSRQVQIEVHAVDYERVTGTVILNAGGGGNEGTPLKRYTCVCLREVSRASMLGFRGFQHADDGVVRDMASTLYVLGRVRQLRQGLEAGYDVMGKLCVPHLVGYISHAVRTYDTEIDPEGGGGGQQQQPQEEQAAYIVGAVVERRDDSPGTMAMRLRASEAATPRAMAETWLDSLHETLQVLHSHGMAWGGAAALVNGEASGEYLASCVEIISDKPWLLRGYGVQGEEGIRSDLEALRRLGELVPRRRRFSWRFLKRDRAEWDK